MNDEKRDATFQTAKDSNVLGCFDKGLSCVFDHERIWKGGYDAGFADTTAEVLDKAIERVNQLPFETACCDCIQKGEIMGLLEEMKNAK